MSNRATSRFPAILIGGPPNAGKSVLSYNLKKALSQRGVRCYLLRAVPDGEGDWFLEAKPAVAEAERHKGKHTPTWIERMGRDIAYRPLPFLVDVGGRPTSNDEPIFDQCTHAILLIKDVADLAEWQTVVERYNLITLAVLTSRLTGESTLGNERPVVQGTITGLNRGATAQGPVFEALLQRVQALFAYDPAELVNIHWNQAPVDVVVDIPAMFRQLNPNRTDLQWEPADVPLVLNYLPGDEPLALYGRGPGWLYAAVAAYVAPQPFYQFDARLGWVAPVILSAKAEVNSALTFVLSATAQYLHLDFSLPEQYLTYETHLSLPLPAVPVDRGVILDGRLPNWLYTGLSLFYQTAPWVAMYAPQRHQAIVVAAQGGASYTIGQTLEMLT